jgi:transposase-like protein
MFKRIRTPLEHIYNALQSYSSWLSLRKTSQRLLPLIKRSHISIWNWIQRYKPRKIIQSRKRIAEFIIDETLIKAGNEYVWLLWIAVKSANKTVLGIRISFEMNILLAEQLFNIYQHLIRKYGKRSLSTDGGTPYPQECRFLNLEHHLKYSLGKNIIELTIQYIKDRTDALMTIFHVEKIAVIYNT